MSPAWLTITAWIWLGVAGVCALMLVADIFVRGYRQRMPVMEAVWPVTALYFGPLAIPMYARWGRPSSPRWQRQHGDPQPRPFAATVALGVSHCGAGCTIGDIIGGWLVFALALEVAGAALYPEYAVDYVLAFGLGIVFQYFAIAPMRGLGLRKGLVAAVKADTVSLTAFEVGLFGWMAVVQLVLFAPEHLSADHATYWLMMQLGMVIGFATAFPANWWLIRRGIKEAM